MYCLVAILDIEALLYCSDVQELQNTAFQLPRFFVFSLVMEPSVSIVPIFLGVSALSVLVFLPRKFCSFTLVYELCHLIQVLTLSFAFAYEVFQRSAKIDWTKSAKDYSWLYFRVNFRIPPYYINLGG